jgi:putative glycosyltransferase (TIGR04372 family)
MIRKLLFTVGVMGNIPLEQALTARIGKVPSCIIIFIIKVVSLNAPFFLIRIFPNFICVILLSAALRYKCNETRFSVYTNKIAKSKKYKKYYSHVMYSFKLSRYGVESVENFINSSFLNHIANNDLEIPTTWVWTNLNLSRNFSFQQKIKRFVETSDSDLASDWVRFLPDHTRHMGHLGALFLYGNYYRKTDPGRVIQILPNEAANKFYLNELLKIFPLKVSLLSDSNYRNHLKLNSIDNLFLSRVRSGIWRFEPLMACGSGQSFPEFSVDSDFKLESNLEFSDISIDKLKGIGFEPSKWFVILHVKEGPLGYKASGETRDASVESYELSCKLIRDLGGQVIRMGGPNFPKLNKKFPAVDYAHSEIKSEYIDYWLWANCKFWLGNSNGAAVAVIPFGKSRLITDQWPWDPNGPIIDLHVPKLIYDNKKSEFLTPEETISSELGRAMSRNRIADSGLTLIDNSPELIQASTLEMFNLLEHKNSLKSNTGINSQNLDLRIHSATQTPTTTPRMQLSNAFRKYYEEKLENR